MRRRNYIIAFLILTFVALVTSAEFSMKVTPSTTRIGMQDRLTLDVVFEGTDLGNISAPPLPPEAEEDWRLDGKNSSTSTNISIVNGKMESNKTITYHYYLSPKRKGKLQIPAMVATHNGKEFRSRPYSIEVVDGSVGRSASQNRPSTRNRPSTSTQPNNNDDINDAIFLSAAVNKHDVYVGEPVIMTYTLYNRAQLLQLGLAKDATYPGFWAEDLFNADKINWNSTTIRGKRYNAMLIRRSVLYPGSSGEKITSPMEIDCVVQGRTRDFFDFFGSRKQITVKSKPVKINVKPLPKSGQPADFSGAVGDFGISMSADQNTCQANNAIQLSIKIRGTGNLRAIDEIEPKLPAAFELYESSQSEKLISSRTGEREKTYQYVVIPREKGTFTIPSVTLSYFDTDAEQYRRVTSKPVELNILEGMKEYSSSTIITKDDVISVGKDIAFIKTSRPDSENDLRKMKLEKPDANFFAYLIPAELLLIGFALFIRKRRQRLFHDTSYARFVGAASMAVSRIKNAKKSDKHLIGEIAEAFEHYIADKLDIVFGEHPPEKISQMLQEKGAGSEILERINKLRAELDVARFAPGASSIKPDEAKDEAIELIRRIEKSIKSKE